MIIEFGNWQLRKCDALNWQLWHRVVPSKGNNVGIPTWKACGKFYSYSTFANAVEYAVDYELREMDGTFSPWEFLEEYRSMLSRFEKSILRCLETPTKGV